MATESALLAATGAIYDAGVDAALAGRTGANNRAAGQHRQHRRLLDTSARMGWRTQARIDERAVADYLDHYRPLDPTMRLV